MKPLFYLLTLLAQTSVTPDFALEKLRQGNLRFSENELISSRREYSFGALLASKQEPFAIIVSCSDSRAPPELLFDQGVGELFVVRVAGNIVGPLELESIAYGVHYLHAPLIVVLGHENCGAVQAVCEKNTKDIPEIASHIQPAVGDCKGNLEMAIKDNVRNVVAGLKTAKPFEQFVQEGKLKVVGAFYDLNTGKVEFL